jgi:hypothetical protein
MSHNKDTRAERLAGRQLGRDRANECLKLIIHVFQNVCADANERRAFTSRLRRQLEQLTLAVVSQKEGARRQVERAARRARKMS